MVSLAESAAFVAYEASSVASALAPWSAVMLASRLASCAATKASVARPSRTFAIFVSTSTTRPPWRAGRPARLRPPRPQDGGVSARELGGQRCGGDGPQESVGHLGVHHALQHSKADWSASRKEFCQERFLSGSGLCQEGILSGKVFAGNRSFKHVYICSRRRLSPVAKASAKELSASYSARGSIPAASAVEYHSVRSEKFPFIFP